MKVDKKDICKNLPKKGFKREEDKHHIYFHHKYNGKDTGVYTYVSHGSKMREYSGRLITELRKQLKLDSNQDTCDLINCPMDEETYISILKNKGLVVDDQN